MGGIPFVMSVHDLQHRLQPQFPEVSANGEWEAREFDLGNGIERATLILVDSEVGMEDVLTFYGDRITPDRIRILPSVPPPYLAVRASDWALAATRQKYSLPDTYLFYPAQFWPHKNHVRLVQAMALLKQRGVEVPPLVLTGSHSTPIREHEFARMQVTARGSRVEDQIHYLGLVPDEDMAALYGSASGLIFPTFFGPTNIPVVEAWSVGCPVLTSDIRGIREQVGDAALLADPGSVESIARGIERLTLDEDLRRTIVERGRKRLEEYTFEDFAARLRAIVDEARCLVATQYRRQGEARDSFGRH